VVANLESPLVTEAAIPLEGKCTLHGSPGWAEALKECGIGLECIANNHLMDYGVEGLRSTLQALDEAGIVHVGAGMDKATACSPAYVDVADEKLAFWAVAA
jgi:poly-gamma-glutamate synthesis protein (capsule biosynthesis protein)